mgnify:CR=1 FL=1
MMKTYVFWIIASIVYLITVVLLLLFMRGASGPDTKQKRDQDWEDLQEDIKTKKQRKA